LAAHLTELPPDTGELGRQLEQISTQWEKELGVHHYTIDLRILLECWLLVKKRYEERKIPMEIFWRSFHDMYCKLMECRNVYHINGIFVGFWYDRFFNLSRFALGRLQFEKIAYPFEEEFKAQNLTLKQGSPVVNMHIPSEGPLTASLVEDALAQARDFYPECQAFVMDSWLLDPDLVSRLPQGNLREFTSRFEVVHVVKQDVFEDGWRVFGSETGKAFDELPRRTSLQRSIADYLKEGGHLGEGFGVLIR
jgi:hypothetical protein